MKKMFLFATADMRQIMRCNKRRVGKDLSGKQNEKLVSFDGIKIDFQQTGNMPNYRNSKYKYNKILHD